MNREPATDGDSTAGAVEIEQLTESYRFDSELAALLTEWQYRDDGIRLTANADRPLPADAIDPVTPGLDTVYSAGASLVFLCYDNREHTMVNPIETRLIEALTTAVPRDGQPQPDGGASKPLDEGPTADAAAGESAAVDKSESPAGPLSLGVVTPHNAQRGALDTNLPDEITANTVEKYQGGERDIIAVSATVSDPRFARQEERFILNPRRLLVAISRSRLLTVVVCSTALFEIVPEDSERLDDGPIWARLFTQAVGRDPEPAWAGSLGEFVGDDSTDHGDVPVQLYPSTLDVDGGDT